MSSPILSTTAPRIQTPATAPLPRPQTSAAPTPTPETSSDRVELSREASGAAGGSSALHSGLNSNYRERKAQLDKDLNKIILRQRGDGKSSAKIRATMKGLL